MIFVTLGSQKFQFDRLLRKIDAMVATGTINERVYAQTGSSEYIPQNYEWKRFLNREEFSAMIDQSDVIITHGGTGVIIGAVKKGKKVIAVPRLAEYGEHVDDHQLQLLHQFDDLGLICPCYDLEGLDDIYRTIGEKTFKPYVSNTNAIVDSIDQYIRTLC